MKLAFARAALVAALACSACPQTPPARRLVILKIDGLNADLLYRTMRERNPETGKSRLPWFAHIFDENGAVFENFYTRGISLSAPSWSMLDTGRHGIIRGNAEYDRYTGEVYDYLNFFPFYLGYARNREVDMPGVEVLDRAGIPLLIDNFPYQQVFQGFQLFQRGVRWTTLSHVLERRFSSRVLFSSVESANTPSLDELLSQQTEQELNQHLAQPAVLYLDLFSGLVDHEGHATNQPAALVDVLQRLDALAGRLLTAIQKSPLAAQTIFVAVSDHGMNNVPGIFSQGFSLPDLFNTPAGGAHHVVTDRHLLEEFKLRGLDPLVHRVITPSTASFYLAGESSRYPTAWLDFDGNERAAVHLRNSDINKIHILLLELAKPNLPPALGDAAATCIRETIDRHRSAWSGTVSELSQELTALERAIVQRKKTIGHPPDHWSAEQRARGQDRASRRLSDELQAWQHEHAAYTTYLAHLRTLLAWEPAHPAQFKISDLIPEMSLGDNNSVAQLRHYIAGPAADGLKLDANGRLDEPRSFRYIDYFSLLAAQRVRNNPQSGISPRPIDFAAMRLPDIGAQHAYWLYSDEQNQLLITTAADARLRLTPVEKLTEDDAGQIVFTAQSWHAGLPMHLLEDPELTVPPDGDRAAWLSGPHTEHEWLQAIHRCKYSNGIIGIVEDLSPVVDNVPGPPGLDPLLLRYERRRRELVQADFQVFASDHWNFNVRDFNPGGNHGAFFRISTHSVWMLAGAGIPNQHIEQPYDTLNFASTLLTLLGKPAPMRERVVPLQGASSTSSP